MLIHTFEAVVCASILALNMMWMMTLVYVFSGVVAHVVRRYKRGVFPLIWR
jgi:hypothetical protein